jgi:NDP-sugar pyrophosphorylase family protein
MRLRPYTAVIPKPLMPVGDRPVLDIVVRQLKHAGFERITIATGYLAELIEAFFGDGSNYGIPIDYHRETEPLGTVGALALMDGLDDNFLVMNGDTLTDMDYTGLLDRHSNSGAAATIATTEREIQISLGVLHFDESNGSDDSHRLTGYTEKPQIKYQASMGVYCFSPEAISYIKPGERLDFPDLILRLLAEGKEVRGWVCKDYWLDIGRHDDYEQAQSEFDRMRDRLIPQE